MKPNIRQTVESKQLSQKINHDTTTNVRSFHIDDQVLVKNFHNSGKKWLQGQIIKSIGPLSYLIKLSDGRIFRCHIDHLRKCHIPQNPKYVVNDSIPDFSDVIFPDQVAENDTDSDVRRYPHRDRRPPDRYRP